MDTDAILSTVCFKNVVTEWIECMVHHEVHVARKPKHGFLMFIEPAESAIFTKICRNGAMLSFLLENERFLLLKFLVYLLVSCRSMRFAIEMFRLSSSQRCCSKVKCFLFFFAIWDFRILSDWWTWILQRLDAIIIHDAIDYYRKYESFHQQSCE